MTEVAEEPDYVGLVWHGHHEALIEWCYGYHERERYIREEKAQEESPDDITLRLRLFKPVKGKLSEEVSRVFEGVSRARASLETATAAYHKARVGEGTAYVAMDEATAAYNTAIAAYRKARTDLDAAHVGIDQATDAYFTAAAAHNTAAATYNTAIAAYRKARTDLDAACAVLSEARLDLGMAADNARHVVFRSHRAEIASLHAQECPNCPWNGKTIFPNRIAAV